MANNAILWENGNDAQGNVMTDTELSALAAGAVSVEGPAYDNTTLCDTYGRFRLDIDFVSAPTSGGFVIIFATLADDGTNYTTATTTVADLGTLEYLAIINVPASSAALKLRSTRFAVPSGKWKPVAYNATSQPFPTTASTVLKLFTNNDEIQ